MTANSMNGQNNGSAWHVDISAEAMNARHQYLLWREQAAAEAERRAELKLELDRWENEGGRAIAVPSYEITPRRNNE
jgi:hypothetical protein